MTPEELHAATGCNFAVAQQFAAPLTTVCEKRGINDNDRIAAFIGQCAHESALFTRLEESLWYSAQRIMAVWPHRFYDPTELDQPAIAEAVAAGRFNALDYERNPEKLGNVVYAFRNGNGAPESGDGFRFRGRGLFQLTGKNAYMRYMADSHVEVLVHPELLLQPDIAADSAGWFWQVNGCNALADSHDWKALTERINGGLNGYTQRLALIEQALGVLA